MQLNISRLKKYMMCQRAAFYNYQHHIQGERNIPQVVGTAFHKGFATWQAKNDWQLALHDARTCFDNDIQKAGLDTEYDFENEINWELIEAMLEKAKYKWRELGMEIIQPECEFKVEIPGTHHNDITVHWLEKVWDGDVWRPEERWGMPTPRAIVERRVLKPHPWSEEQDCSCWQPHVLHGRVDGILSKNGKIWLQEHKTTAVTGEMFNAQWYLDIQLTAYVYAIWKVLGMKPEGVVLNAIKKPTRTQVAHWARNNGKSEKDYVGFESELYQRTMKDCLRFEKEFTTWANMWESSILNGTFPMSPFAFHCQAYNRKCDYFDLCVNHEDESYMEQMTARELDYVDESRQQLLIQIGVAK